MFIIAPAIKIRVSVGLMFAIMLMVIHFGINPVRGGRPLNDRRRTGINILYMGDWEINLLEEFVFLTFLM